MKIAIFVAGLCLAATLSHAKDRVMRVTGQGSAQAVPDQATVSLGVVSQAVSAREALRDNAAAMTRLIDILQKAGVEERHVQTSRLSLNPSYARRSNSNPEQPPAIVGYSANTQVSVIIRDIGALGAVLDDLTRSGTNQIGGIGFSVAQPEPLLNEARRRAVADARAKAKLYAQAAGVTLGEVLMLTDGSAPQPGPMPLARAEAFAADMPIAAGEVGISATVTLEYALE